MPDILPSILSPRDLAGLSIEQLEQLAGEMRRSLTEDVSTELGYDAEGDRRAAHGGGDLSGPRRHARRTMKRDGPGTALPETP